MEGGGQCLSRLQLWEKYQAFREQIDEPGFRQRRRHLFEPNTRRQLKVSTWPLIMDFVRAGLCSKASA